MKWRLLFIHLYLKRNYFADKLEDNKHNSKLLWKSLKELGLPSKKRASSSSITGLRINDALCFDKLNVAEQNLIYSTKLLLLIL